MPTAVENAIAALMEQRSIAQAAYKKLLSEPEAYSIQGSVSATNRKLADLQAQVAEIDSKIRSLLSLGKGGAAIINRMYPNYSSNN